MAKRKERKTEGEAAFDLGLGGLFKGLSEFLGLVSEMAEAGKSEVTRSGEFHIKGLGERARGVYGFSVRTGIGGLPQVERFGNLRATAEGAVVEEVREPLVDVFDEEEEVVVVVELPGVGEEEIRSELQDDILALETTGESKYAKEVVLPTPVDPATLTKSYKNGILELRWKKRT